MKRVKLIKYLKSHGCYLDREGGKHAIYRNPENGRCAAVPRHREIKETTVAGICAQLEVPKPGS